MLLLKMALRNIFRNKRRSLLSLSAIALATAVIVFMFALIEGLKYDQYKTVQKFTTGEVLLQHKDFERFRLSYPEEFMLNDVSTLVQALRQTKGITDVMPRLQLQAQLAFRWETIHPGSTEELNIFSDTVPVMGWGMDLSSKGFFSIMPYILPGGRLPSEGEILLGDRLAQRHNLKEGDTVFVFVANQAARFKICGLVALPLEQLRLKNFFVDIQTAQELLGLADQAQEILLSFEHQGATISNKALVTGALTALDLKDLELKSWQEIGNIALYLDLASVSYNFIALFFFVVGTTVIINTIMMVIYERIREIGTLRAMGLSAREVVGLFFLEAFFISLAAAASGIILGVLLVIPFSLNGLDFGKLADLSKMDLAVSNVIYPQLNLASTVFVFIYSVVVSSFISFIPSRRAAKIEPVEALRST